MLFLRQSTASQNVLIGPFVDSTDGVTAETALTISNTDIRLSKNGANIVAKNSGGGTHDENGWYQITLDATDTNTVGRLQVHVNETGALPVWAEFQVLEEDIYDALFDSGANAFNSSAQVAVASLAASSITAAAIASNAITSAKIAADAIGASQIAADAIGSSELATTAVAEIADAVWDEAQSGHTTAGTFGELATEIADILVDTSTTIPGQITGLNDPTAAAIADAVWDEAQSGHVAAGSFGEIATEIASILEDTGTTLPATLTTIDTVVDAILVDTAEIGAAGAGLTGIPWNAAWDAEVQSEVNDGLVALGLDHLVSASVAGTDVTDNSIFARLVSSSATADWDTFVQTTDSLQAIRDRGDAAWAGGGSAPTAAEVADAVWDEAQSGHTTAGTFGEMATEVASILADTNELQSDDVPGLIAALNDPTAAAIADAVWDEAQSGHTTAGTFGEIATEIASILEDTGTTLPGQITGLNDPTAAAIADAVWDEAQSAHVAAGSFGEMATEVAAILVDTGTTLPGSLATVDANVDAILIDTGTTIPAQITGLNDLSAAQVNAEVVDVLTVDAHAEPTGVPTANESIGDKIGYLFMMARNQVTVTSSKKVFFDDSGTAEFEKDLSDDGTTYTETEANAP